MSEAFDAITTAVASATLAQCAQTLGAMETAVDMTREYLLVSFKHWRTDWWI